MADTENEDILKGTWPIGKEFTLALVIKEDTAIHELMKAMHDKTALFHGCEIQRIDFRDLYSEYKAKMEKMKDTLDELADFIRYD